MSVIPLSLGESGIERERGLAENPVLIRCLVEGKRLDANLSAFGGNPVGSLPISLTQTRVCPRAKRTSPDWAGWGGRIRTFEWRNQNPWKPVDLISILTAMLHLCRVGSPP